MERGSRKRSSSAGKEKMERVGDRQEKMEGHCSTGQNPQWAEVPVEEEDSRSQTDKLDGPTLNPHKCFLFFTLYTSSKEPRINLFNCFGIPCGQFDS
jgi:hypothetical protein